MSTPKEEFNPVDFREYLENSYDFEDVDLVEKKIGVMMEHSAQLKQQGGNGTISPVVPTNCSTKRLSDSKVLNDPLSEQVPKEVETKAAQSGSWSKLFVNNMADESKELVIFF